MSSSSSSSSTRLELASDLFTEELVVHLLQSEEALRKSLAVHELYRGVRHRQVAGIFPNEFLPVDKAVDAMEKSYHLRRTETYVLEDDLQRLVLLLHGVSDMRLRLQIDAKTPTDWTLSDPTTKLSVQEHLNSDALLKQWRDLMLTYVLRPAVKQAAFYLKNNIMVPGYQVGDAIDTSIPLYIFSQGGVEDQSNSLCTIQGLLQMAHAAGKRRLVLLAGSIT